MQKNVAHPSATRIQDDESMKLVDALVHLAFEVKFRIGKSSEIVE